MVGINPPDGSIPLRLRPAPNIGFEPLIKVWGLLLKQNKGVRDSSKCPAGGSTDFIFLPHWADYVDEIQPGVGHDLRWGGSRGDGRAHGGQGNGHDRQRLTESQLLLGERREEGGLRLALNHGSFWGGRGHWERSGQGVRGVRCGAGCVGGSGGGWLWGTRSLRNNMN